MRSVAALLIVAPKKNAERLMPSTDLEIPGSSKMRFNPSSALLLIERPARPALMKSVHVVSIKT